MTIDAALEQAAQGGLNAEALGNLARMVLATGEEERALPWLRAAAARSNDARLWQWAGLLERAIESLDLAVISFTQAARLAPNDPSIAHGHARVTLDAGFDAVALFDRARRLDPANGEVLAGFAAALLAAGEGAKAEALLDAVLVQSPLWVQGHLHLSQLRALIGRADQAAASFERALSAHPGEPMLWQGLFDLYVSAENYAALADAVDRARAAGVAARETHDYAAIAAAELGQIARADSLLAATSSPLTVWRIRHLLRQGRLTAALALIENALAGPDRDAIWPYALIAWRLAGDPRVDWLAPSALVKIIDLAPTLPPLDQLADVLRGLHRAQGSYLDQSVRGGTQTDGPLLNRVDPIIQAVRQSITTAVESYVAGLPAIDPAHPMLALRRDRPVRFAGSWSVWLRGGGHHANHLHPQGWMSSALYVALPDRSDDPDPHAGWLTIGEPQAAIGIDQPPLQLIEPRPGQLVLFPSWLWHGTRPFAQGDRLTIAFDVAPPV
ncbi:putative 2OG-Fe(II) oxygenase [Sphingomonas sp. 28-62-11]|uniref:putative 2OG-Fe(II) oxygenase n=1 Tax=Sphingomonas sp. 28-62-11 TaxID=1970432 RepID=UPI000BD70EE0|nr:MAG: hypothetical protein B7Y49_01615 [Sphingomonas sp. 28-62-11]